MKTVVMVAPVHYYDDVRMFQKEAKTLAANGYRVLLLARAESPLVEEGVEVVPLPVVKNRLMRFLGLPGVFRTALMLKGDVYHLHNPDTLPIALLLRMFGRRVVYDTHEDFSKCVLARKWIPEPIRPLVAKSVALLEGMVGRIVDQSIATQPDVRRRLGKNAILIENPPVSQGRSIDEARAHARTLAADDCFRLVYIGLVGTSRGLITMVDALEIANKQVDCRLWLIGPGDEKEIREAKVRPGWKAVDYVERLPQSQAFAYVIESDAGLITFPDVGDNASINPNKMYEYQLFGIPFIASNFEKWRRSVQNESGLFADPTDPHDVANKIVWLAEHPDERKYMGARGRAFVLGSYNWEAESRKLMAAYGRIVG